MRQFFNRLHRSFFTHSRGVVVVLALLAFSNVNAQTYSFQNGALKADLVVKNECDGSANGSIQFNITGVSPGVTQVRVISIIGPSDPDDKYSIFNILIPISSGTGSFTFNGSDVGGNNLPTPQLVDGTYFFQLREVGGATLIINDFVELFDYPPLEDDAVTPSFHLDKTSCTTADGTIEINVTGGSGSYEYVWSNDPLYTLASQGNLDVGTYTVTVNDLFSDCTVQFSFDIEDPLPQRFTMNAPTAICAGEDIVVTAGVPGLGGAGELGVEYSLQLAGTDVLGPIVGDGAIPVSFTLTSGSYAGQEISIVARLLTCVDRPVDNPSTVTVNPLPTIVPSAATACQGSTSGSFTYTTTNSPDQYSIDYNGAAETAGFTDVAFTALTASPLTLAVPGGATPGTYSGTITVRNTVTSCVGTPVAFSVQVTALPALYNVTGTATICADQTAVISLSDSDTGINYVLVRGGSTDVQTVAGTGSAINFTALNIAGTYTVRAVNATTNCVANMTGSAVITVNPLPTLFTVSGGGTICAGGSALAISLSGSQPGVSYTLLRGATTVETIAGTGAALVFTSQSTAGTYTVLATNTTTSCDVTMTGSAIVTVNPLPAVYTVSGTATICADQTAVVSLSDTDTGINYILVRDGATDVQTVAGTGSSINFNALNVAGTYTVRAANATTTCVANMTGSAVITVNPLPALFTVTGGSTICAGDPAAAIGLSGSQSGVSYALFRDGATNVETIAGTGSALAFTAQTTAGTYTVVATNTSTTCDVNMTGSAVITVNALPTLYSVSGTATICAGQTTLVTLSDSDTGIDYILVRDGATDVETVSGTGSAISFAALSTAGTYTVRAVNTTTSCDVSMTGSAVITVTALPTVYTVSGGGTICSDAFATISVSDSDFGVTYQLIRDGVTFVTPSLLGTGSPLNFSNQSTAGTYTVRATISGCSSDMTGSATIITTPAAVAVAGADKGLCNGERIALAGSSISGSASVGTWSIIQPPGGNGTLGFAGATSITDTVTFTASVSGIYRLQLTTDDPATSCTAVMDEVLITVAGNATAFAGVDQQLCAGSSLAFTGSTLGGSASTGTWTIQTQPVGGDGALGYAGAGNPIDTVSFSASVVGTYVLRVTTDDPAGSCTPAFDETTITVSLAATATAGGDQTICSATDATLTGSAVGGSVSQGIWTILSQPVGGDGQLGYVLGTTQPDTVTFTATLAGTYTLRLTSDDPAGICGTVSDDVQITVAPAAIVNAGIDQGLCLGETTTLNGSSVSGVAINGTWSIQSQPVGGDGALGFTTATNPTDTVTFTASVAGNYVLRLTTDEPAGICPAVFDELTIIVASNAIADAGADKESCADSNVVLAGADVSASATSGTWTIISSPASGDGVLGFTGATSQPDTVTFAATITGVYTLRLTTDDPAGTCVPAEDDVEITVVAPAVANAGSDQSVCANGSVTLSGSSVSGAATNGTWNILTSPVGGNGQLGFTGVTTDTDTVTFSASVAGAYVLRLTTNNPAGVCGPATDDVTITVTTLPTAVLSGSTTICQNESATLTLTLTGTAPWSVTYSDGTGNTTLSGIAASPFTFTVSPAGNRSYTLVSMNDATCPTGNVSGSADVVVTPITGNPVTNGSETWIGYVYTDAATPFPPVSNIDFNLSKYRGFIEATDIDAITAASSYDVATDKFNLQLGGQPISGVNVCGSYANDFSIRFRMQKTFTAGTYTFTVGGDDGVQLYIDGVLATLSPANSFSTHSYTTYSTAATALTAGLHTLVIEYFDRGGNARVSFDYQQSSGPQLTSTGDVCVNTAAPTLTASSTDPSVIGFNWYTDAALTNRVATTAAYVPASPAELNLTVPGTTRFYATAVFASGESQPDSIDVTVLAAASISVQDATVCDASGLLDLNTLVTATPTGGDFTFTGTNVNTATDQFDPTGLAGQVVSVQVDYVSGSCLASTNVLVTVTDVASFTLPTVNPQVCESGGLIDLNSFIVSALPAGGDFVFGGGTFVNTATDELDATGQTGTLTITVDYTVGGCVAVQQNLLVDVVTAPQLTLVASTVALCANDDPLDLATNIQSTNPSGGTFVFTDNTGASNISSTEFDPTGLSAGLQNITVQYTAVGCATPITASFDVDVLTPPTITVAAVVPSVCQAGVDVDLLTLVTGNPAGGTFAFTGAGVSGNLFTPGALTGTQTITVAYTNGGCTANATISIPVNTAPNPGILVTLSSEICAGEKGVVQIESQENVLYRLRNNADNSIASSLYRGDGFTRDLITISTLTTTTVYNIIATNLDGSCPTQVTALAEVVVRAPGNPLCGSGGGPIGNEDCSLFSAGQPGIDIARGVPPSCSGADDGSIIINVTGGNTTANYTVYLIDRSIPDSTGLTGPVSTDIVFSNLRPAQYHYRIIDGNGDFCTLPFSLERDATISATASDFEAQFCPGVNDGKAMITVTSAGATFEYSLTGDFTDALPFVSGGEKITNLPGNNSPYNITIRETSRPLCVGTVEVTIPETLIPALDVTWTSVLPTCDNNVGSITVTLSETSTDFRYKFGVGGEVLADLSELPAGNVFDNLAPNEGNEFYQLVVDRAIGCPLDTFDLANLIVPGSVPYSDVVRTDPTCLGDGNDGRIQFTVGTGGSGYQVAVLTENRVPADTEFKPIGTNIVVIDTLKAGNQYVWLKSLAAECATRITPDSTILAGAVPIYFTIDSVAEKCFGEGGFIEMSNITGVNLQDFEYRLKLDGVPFDTATFAYIESLGTVRSMALPPGNYEVTLLQPNTADGCVTTPLETTVFGPNSLLTISDPVTPNPNQETSFLDDPTAARVFVITGGEPVYFIHLLNAFGETIRPVTEVLLVNTSYSLQYAGLPAGTFTAVVDDEFGCQVEKEFVVGLKTEIYIPNIFTPDNDPEQRNEVFFIRNLASQSKLVITNRWGNEVYSSDDYQNDWNAEGVSDGVYYYSLSSGGKEYTGWVEVLRGDKP